jgi:hypothetical protein
MKRTEAGDRKGGWWGTAALRRWSGPLMTAGFCGCLAGCATSADPHEGGFVSGIVGLSGGGYQRRVEERETVHHSEMDAQQRLKAQARALEQERAQVRGDLTRAQARLASQERRIAEERSRLRAQGQGPSAQAGLHQLDQAQARLVSAKGELRGVRPDDQPVTDLKTKSQGIQKELDEIDSMVSVVSGSRF